MIPAVGFSANWALSRLQNARNRRAAARKAAVAMTVAESMQ
jgi:hypothetical protein